MGSFALNNLHSMSRNILLIVFLSLTTVVHAQLWRCVNPLIGSKGEGRVFVGPSVPFGMVKPDPDCLSMPNAGWAPMPDPVKGFSQTHVSGTGGGQKYGNVLIQPFRRHESMTPQKLLLPDGQVAIVPGFLHHRSYEKITLGKYSCKFEDGIWADVTTAARCAIYRFRYADGLLIDAASFLGMDTIPNKRETQQYVAGIDYREALQAMLKDGDVPPEDDEKEGRSGLREYIRLGYVPYGISRAGTRTVEYSYDDWCIAQVAKGLGKRAVYNRYMCRSRSWQNLWCKDYEWRGMTGFILPRDASGRWLDSVEWGRSKVFRPKIAYHPDTKVAPWYIPWWDTSYIVAFPTQPTACRATTTAALCRDGCFGRCLAAIPWPDKGNISRSSRYTSLRKLWLRVMAKPRCTLCSTDSTATGHYVHPGRATRWW